MDLRRLEILAMMGASVAASVVACRPSDVLSVPPPAGVTAAGSLTSQAGAEAVYANARSQLFDAADGNLRDGVLVWSELMTDELTFSNFSQLGSFAHVDARQTAGNSFSFEVGDVPWQGLLNARSVLLLAAPALAQYEPPSGQSKVGEAYALAGFAELFLAEDYCDGTPLDQVAPTGTGVQYGTPLTTDSLLGVAEDHFDSALAHASGDATVESLARVGLGRALLDRAQYPAAGSAVAAVPVDFVYNAELSPVYRDGGMHRANPYAYAYTYPFGPGYRFFNVADGEGQTGLNYLSAHDARLTFDSSLMTPDGGTWYLPAKFETNFAFVPLATGVEAALIQAEVALQTGDPGASSAALNTLRIAAPSTYLALAAPMDTLSSDSTTGATAADRVSVVFRERAFWLFGTGTRLGDLRRLMRQYGRDQSTVFPTGAYPNGNDPNLPSPLPNYGTDVDLTLPTPAGLAGEGLSGITNPRYKGCLTSTQTG